LRSVSPHRIDVQADADGPAHAGAGVKLRAAPSAVIVRSGSDAIHVSASGAMDCFAWLAMTKLDQRVRQNNTTGKSAKTCQAPFEKIFRYACRANQWLKSARLTANEGRLEIVTNVR